MALMRGSGILYIDGVAVGMVEGGELTYSMDELLRPVAITVTVGSYDAELPERYAPVNHAHSGLGSPDSGRGASVDDLIDNIDAVLESYRSGS